VAEKFNRASLLQSAVAPASGGGVKVALKDPGLAESVSGFGTLSKRLDAFSSTAFSIAGKQAKALGTLYGAKHAPTYDQLIKAQETGAVIELPGDPTSLKIADQAAYAAGLSRLEDTTEIAGRRALTDAMAEAAADPSMDPKTFTANLDTIITEYSNVLGAISPSSAGKVNASLSMVANSQVVSFSREFMSKAIKQQVNISKENANTIINTAPDVITGHQANRDVTLLEKLTKDKSRVRSILEKIPGIGEDYILRAEKRFDTNIRKAQEDAVLRWARTTESFFENPTGAVRELQKFDLNKSSTVPDHIKDVWKITDDATRNKVFSSLSSLAGELNKLADMENARTKQNRDTFIQTYTDNFNKAYTAPNKSWQERARGMNAAILKLNSIGHDTTDMQEIVDRGPITRLESNVADKSKLMKAKSMGALTLRMIMDSHLNGDDADTFVNDLSSQRDKNVGKALQDIKSDPLFKNLPDLNTDPNMDDTKTSVIRRRYLQAQDIVYKERTKFENALKEKMRLGQEIKSTDYFNASEVAVDAVKTVHTRMINVDISNYRKQVENGLKVLRNIGKNIKGFLPFDETQSGLRQALDSTVTTWSGTNPRYKKNPEGKYIGRDAKALSRALKALQAIFELEESLEELGAD